MVWFISACALLVLLAASFAAVGRLGAMPDAVVDTFRPAQLDDVAQPLEPTGLRFGTVLRGYARRPVDSFLAQVDAGTVTADELAAVTFPVATPGYAMDQVDQALERLGEQARAVPEPDDGAAESAASPGAQPADRE